MSIFPFDDPVIVIRLTRKQLLLALENGFSQVPKQEGRFPQVSNMRVRYDTTRPPGKRVVSVEVGPRAGEKGTGFVNFTAVTPNPESATETQTLWRPLDPEESFTVATRAYLVAGKDGYDALFGAEEIVGHEEGNSIA